jgi:DNA polymerase-3 subunit delta
MAKSKSSTAAGAVAALDFLAAPTPPRGVCVLFGDEPFLKSRVLAALREAVLGADDGEFSGRTFLGDEVEPRTVFDELATVALFGAAGSRMAIVAEADGFVTKYRAVLEDYFERSAGKGAAQTSGEREGDSPILLTANRKIGTVPGKIGTVPVLVLEVDSWPTSTRLFKHLAQHGLQIDCKAPEEPRILKWLEHWVARTYQARLGPGAGERLLEVVGPQMGRLDQELAKLSMIAATPQRSPRASGEREGDSPILLTGHRKIGTVPGEIGTVPVITTELVEQAVGGWRAKTAWQMIDAAAAGDAREALVQLDRLLLAGENPIGLLAQAAAPLRRLGAAARIVQREQAAGRRITLRAALEQAGVSRWPKALDSAEQQMRQLGARRAGKLFQWLIEADLALKSTSSSGERARLVLEELFVRLSRQLAPARR